MDGNGRWAEQRSLLRFEGHKAGIDAVKTVVQCCIQKGIPVLSLFAFSSENWLRPQEEVVFLMHLFLEALQLEVKSLHENNIRLRFTGNREGLSPAICEQMDIAEALTVNNKTLVLNLALNYGGKWEITQAAARIAQDVKIGNLAVEAINEACFAKYLLTQDLPEPDLFIRTSGERRISNFFLWQLAYTELYFTNTLWPDFTEKEFERALASFAERKRRYGKISQQTEENSSV